MDWLLRHPGLVLSTVVVAFTLTFLLVMLLQGGRLSPAQLSEQANERCGSGVRQITPLKKGVYVVCLSGEALFIER